jgi:acetyl-CoA acetyltransferase
MVIRPTYENSAVIGVGQSIYTRHPDPGLVAHHFIRDAIAAALDDAEMTLDEIDGLAISSMSIAPDAAVDAAWRLGIAVRWLHQDTNGGSSAISAFGAAVRAIEMGAARNILVVAGDATGLEGYAEIAKNFNRAIRDHAAALGYGGPNTAYAMVTARQMKAYGLEKTDYGHIAIAQRTWAAGNPFAVYRTPMTMDDYLQAPMVVDPLCRFDCVPVVAGGQAIVLAHPDRVPKGRVPVRVKALGYSYNHDHQATDGLKTGASIFAKDLWDEAGLGPDDVDVASLYDDYPSIIVAQLDDLGFIPDHDAKRFIATRIKDRSFPINTWGGMLSAGQPGGPAGGLNGISEVTLQLQNRAGERQVPNAKIGLSTGYGMTMYRYGATAGAAILEAGS